MDAKQAIESAMNAGLVIMKKYLSDLDDRDLMERPGPGCNHLAWQLGHLISSEARLIEMLSPGSGPSLPDGFAEKHAKEQCGVDDPNQFCTKQEYLDLFDQVRAVSKTTLQEFPVEKLDAPGPERMQAIFPTLGSMFLLIATHPTLHAGQFVVVRRRVNKPIVI